MKASWVLIQLNRSMLFPRELLRQARDMTSYQVSFDGRSARGTLAPCKSIVGQFTTAERPEGGLGGSRDP